MFASALQWLQRLPLENMSFIDTSFSLCGRYSSLLDKRRGSFMGTGATEGIGRFRGFYQMWERCFDLDFELQYVFWIDTLFTISKNYLTSG